MNYSVELWDSYNKVENNLLFHLRGLKDFIYLIKELSKSMKIFSDNLKKIYDINLSITTNESLSKGIDNFRINIYCHHIFLEKYINNINSQIIVPLNAFQESSLKLLNKNYKETINAEKNYESYISQIEFTKNKFYSRVKQAEQKLLEFKTNKANKNIIEKDIRKYEEEIKSHIGYAKDSEKIYLSYIKYTNWVQDEFIEIKKRNLNEIQSLEIELGEKIKKSLNKYYTFQANYLKNLNLETEKNIKSLDEIDVYSDINIYIKNNRTDDIPPVMFEYEPYISNLDSQANNKNIEIIKEVIGQIKKIFPEEKDISQLRTKTDKEIEKFIESILNGENEKVVNSNEENLKILSKKHSRRLFLNFLNKSRNNSNIILNDLSYKILGNLLIECLNYSYKEKDIKSIKLIIVISTSLFKFNKASNKPRIFLHNYLAKNLIWKEFNFWEILIKYNINEEMHNQKKYNLFSNENDVLRNVRIKDIVKKQLNTNLYDMISFEVNPSLMNKIINHFSNLYKLQQYSIESLNDIINNYKSTKIEIKEKKKLNSSFDLSLMTNKTNGYKNNFFTERDIKLSKNNAIEPVKQDDIIINDCFEDIDKEIDKKNGNIFFEKNYDNIVIKESKNKIRSESDEDGNLEEKTKKINNGDKNTINKKDI